MQNKTMQTVVIEIVTKTHTNVTFNMLMFQILMNATTQIYVRMEERVSTPRAHISVTVHPSGLACTAKMVSSIKLFSIWEYIISSHYEWKKFSTCIQLSIFFSRLVLGMTNTCIIYICIYALILFTLFTWLKPLLIAWTSQSIICQRDQSWWTISCIYSSCMFFVKNLSLNCRSFVPNIKKNHFWCCCVVHYIHLKKQQIIYIFNAIAY